MLNVILIAILIVIPTSFGAFGKYKEMGLSIIAVSIALSFNNIDRFVKFKGGGFEAELRIDTAVTNANKASEKAYAALDQVRKLAVALTDATVTTLAVPGPFQYVHLKYKIDQIEHVKSALRGLGLPEKDIEEAVSTFTTRVKSDHIRRILGAINKELPNDKKLFTDSFDIDVSAWNMERIKKFLEANSIAIEGEIKEAIQDLEYYERNGKLRREDMWQG